MGDKNRRHAQENRSTIKIERIPHRHDKADDTACNAIALQLAHQLRHHRCRRGTGERKEQLISKVLDQLEDVLADEITNAAEDHQGKNNQCQVNHTNQLEQGQ
ncbi:hypothetical protein D3C76_1513630 [compost metagenome]